MNPHSYIKRQSRILIRRAFELFLLLLMLLVSSTSFAKQPRRSGFTMVLGFGVGSIQVAGLNQYGKERIDWGFEPHAISFGGFLNNDVALLGRWKSTYHFTPNSEGESANRFLGTFTLNAQWWFRPRVFVGAGVGVATFGYGFGSAPDDPAWSVGGALTARIGYAFALFDHHALKLSFEIVTGFFGGGVASGETLNIEWQYY